MTLQARQFAPFFRALWGHAPFPWQERLAEQVCGSNWPQTIDLPTASGKTACLDIAVFALAVQAERPPTERTIGRRIFFVVNRRIIVDEAYERAREIARKLRDDTHRPVLGAVASALRQLTGDIHAPALDAAILRGGIYHDNRWVRSITQPTIITSTIDQVGSRLLFRGYGVSEAARPLHAALVAHDSLLLLDEAHISRPFAQTIRAVQAYRGERWATQPLSTPFEVVQLTATPDQAVQEVFSLSDEDRQHPVLAARLTAPKPVELLPAKKTKGDKSLDELAQVLVDRAGGLLSDQFRTVAVIANRVATARRVYELLSKNPKDGAEVRLVIGRMRPLDRDDLTAMIQARVGKSSQGGTENRPLFVVATQCLEVGADFDFDAMVSECASLDALRQRFGRLNRRGRPIEGRGCITPPDQKDRGDDPIYGSALAETWRWLESIAHHRMVDFGITAMERALAGVDLTPLVAPRVDAPVMFPAYVDAWAQTSPAPAPDPDVTIFLHGPQRGEPDVQVCWRADLPEEADRDKWTQIVSLCPPSSPECMPVPIGVVRAWLADKDVGDERRGDLLDAGAPEGSAATAAQPVLVWRGIADSRLVRSADDIRPGDTIILPARAGGWSIFGHIPGLPADAGAAEQVDIAERAFRQSRDRVLLRLTPPRLANWPPSDATTALRAWLGDPEANPPGVANLLVQVAGTLPQESSSLADALGLLANRKDDLTCERYPAPLEGIVLTTRRRIGTTDVFLPALDDGEDDTSRNSRRRPVSLKDHTAHVRSVLDDTLVLLSIAPWRQALDAAARFHDQGKADERFQALLLNGDLTDAWAQTTLWAKSARLPKTWAQRIAAYRRSSLPAGFRHEMLSAQLAESAPDLPTDAILRDLALHLVTSHHGYGRPFAPVVMDDSPPDVSVPDLGVSITREQRLERPAHRLDSGIADRFWALTRHFGWWGLAYLEAVLRLADQRASEREDEQEAAA